MTVFILAPTLFDARAIQERHIVGSTQKVLLFSSDNPDSLRGVTILPSDVVIANDGHLSRYVGEEFMENLGYSTRAGTPTLIDVGLT